jgi:hypothetical protein
MKVVLTDEQRERAVRMLSRFPADVNLAGNALAAAFTRETQLKGVPHQVFQSAVLQMAEAVRAAMEDQPPTVDLVGEPVNTLAI